MFHAVSLYCYTSESIAMRTDLLKRTTTSDLRDDSSGDPTLGPAANVSVVPGGGHLLESARVGMDSVGQIARGETRHGHPDDTLALVDSGLRQRVDAAVEVVHGSLSIGNRDDASQQEDGVGSRSEDLVDDVHHAVRRIVEVEVLGDVVCSGVQENNLDGCELTKPMARP
jgi:hypothetical protein